MGQVLHNCARTTAAVRRAIQHSQESLLKLAERYDLNPKTVQKWRRRCFVEDAPMGPKEPHSTTLTREQEAIAVAFRKHTLLPLDDCLYALQAPRSRNSLVPRSIAASNVMASAVCRASMLRLLPERSLKIIPSATFTSISPRSEPRRENSISSSPSTALQSSPSLVWSRRPLAARPLTSCKNSSRPSPTKSTPS